MLFIKTALFICLKTTQKAEMNRREMKKEIFIKANEIEKTP